MSDDQTPIFSADDDDEDDDDLTPTPEDSNGSARLETIVDPTAEAANREEAARSLLAAIEQGDNPDAYDPVDDGDSTAEESVPSVAFNFHPCEPPSDHPLFFELEAWVRWLVWHFELGETVPPCWAEHPAVVEEMAGLYEGWTGIYTASAEGHHPLDQLSWLGHLDSSLARVATKWDRSGCGPRGVHENKTRSVWPDMAEPNSSHPRVISALVGMTTGDAEPF
ncbi:MAG TPA: hypothetical protein VHU85_08225 [Acidimicrobiales bacterium]|jgi:hypothetical protein|nr:hypothetical protein [Acidimicrobiales bacterium]